MPSLCPNIEPYDHGMLDVGDGNQVYWETCAGVITNRALTKIELSDGRFGVIYCPRRGDRIQPRVLTLGTARPGDAP
jgi:hypothetical protein